MNTTRTGVYEGDEDVFRNRSGILLLGFSANGQAPGATDAGSKPEKPEESIPIPPEFVGYEHDWTTGGQTIHYTATAGNLLIKDDKDKVNGNIFYVAYTEDRADAKTRPVTFFYNGSPGLRHHLAA